MIHAAVEQCRPGDILVVTTDLAVDRRDVRRAARHSLLARGVRGLVIDAGRARRGELREMGFPVWSRAISAQGTVKATAGSVNVPVVVGGQLVHPGDVILADDDGVSCVPRARRRPGRSRPPRRAMAKEDAQARPLAGGRARPRHATACARCSRRSACGTCDRGSRTADDATVRAAMPLHADARRHVEGRLLPRRRPAGRPGGARRPAAAGHGLARPAPDRRHRRRPSADQQGRGGVAVARRPTPTSTTCSCRSASTRPTVTDRQNCGNLLAGVGPFAIERGLVPRRRRDAGARSAWSTPAARRRPRFPTPGGRVDYAGDTAIAGVPGTAAPVLLDFADTAGSTCRRAAARPGNSSTRSTACR